MPCLSHLYTTRNKYIFDIFAGADTIAGNISSIRCACEQISTRWKLAYERVLDDQLKAA